MRLYIGKTKETLMWGPEYEIGTKKSGLRGENGFTQGSCLYTFCDFEFEKITGLKLAPGEIRKVKRIVIEVE